MKKYSNYIISIFSILFTFFFIYLILFIFVYINYENFEIKYFKNESILNFHEKYSNKLHHTRPSDNNDVFEVLTKKHEIPLDKLNKEFKREIINEKELLFNFISEKSNNEKILLQGDSWVEQFNYYLQSNISLKKFSKDKNFDIINAGVSSFSPSLMSIQFDILEKDFNISPKYIVAYIDQTDIGDELCRYRNNKVFDNNGKLISVKPSIHEFPAQWKITELNFSKKKILVKSFELSNFYINSFYSKVVNKFLKYFDKGINYCSYGEIQSYLLQNKVENINYFKNSLKLYLDNLLNRDYLKKIIIISFPHKQHFNKDEKNNQIQYKVNVSDLIDEVISNENKITHINFSKEIIMNSSIEINDLWIKNDVSSHIKPIYHNNLITKRILEEIQK